MCDPLSQGLIAGSGGDEAKAGVAALAGGSLGLNAFTSYQGAKVERAQARYQAAINENNALMADASAVDAVLQGSEDANRVRRQGRKVGGQQRAALAAGGVDVNTGVAAQLQDETEYFTELDATTVRNNAARAAWGFRAEAQDYRSNAQMSRAVAKSKSPGRAAGLSILGDVTKVGMQFATMGAGG